jgi:hypothetical protein
MGGMKSVQAATMVILALTSSGLFTGSPKLANRSRADKRARSYMTALGVSDGLAEESIPGT